MSCQDTQNLMHGYVDGELDLMRNLEIEQHLQGCSACTLSHQNNQALKSAISNGSLYFKAPVHLQKRVRRAVRAASKDVPRPVMWSRRWLAAGASLALMAIIIGSLVFVRPSPSADDLMAQEILSGHVRSLMASHLTDVTSSDQHTVKPWFAGKLDFSPAVIDLTTQGFPLVGGRLDYVANRPVAALVYQRRQYFINLFIWPSTDDADSRNKMAVRQGYNLIHWNRAGMIYWAISDLNISELQEFAQVLQNPT